MFETPVVCTMSSSPFLLPLLNRRDHFIHRMLWYEDNGLRSNTYISLQTQFDHTINHDYHSQPFDFRSSCCSPCKLCTHSSSVSDPLRYLWQYWSLPVFTESLSTPRGVDRLGCLSSVIETKRQLGTDQPSSRQTNEYYNIAQKCAVLLFFDSLPAATFQGDLLIPLAKSSQVCPSDLSQQDPL